MKKGKFLILGLIALLLAGGLVLASCAETCTAGNCGKKTNDCVTLCKGKGGALDVNFCETSCGIFGK